MKEDDARDRVVEGAVRLIESGGLAKLSMREVAREAGVSHQAPYHWFADCEAILASIAEAGFKELGDRMRAARAKGKTAIEKLTKIGEAYVQFACEKSAHFRVMFRADFVDVARFPGAKKRADQTFDLVPEVVAEAVAEGLPPNPSEMAIVILGWSVSHGLAGLLLDGPLAMKMPDASPTDVTRSVMHAFRRLMEARITPTSRTAPVPSSRPNPGKKRRPPARRR